MQEIGTVISVKDRAVIVEVSRKEACSTCGRCGGRLSLGGDTMIVEAVKTGNPKPGDLVVLELPDADYLRLSFLVYMLPLLSLGLGYAGGWFLGSFLGNASVWAAVFAAGGLVGCFAWLRSYDAASRKAGKYMPVARPLDD
ncbi:MAG: SoxR reducing system RseC family protein [Bacillota bacterium]|nr:SoxR reducing system RseC family protein [Candidatus Fermentithermobacillaceae bacterium]